jgi:2-methylcitrate dehydratase PrpD
MSTGTRFEPDTAVPITQVIARHVAAARLADYRPGSVNLAKQLVLDSIANALAGSDTDAGRTIRRYAMRYLAGSAGGAGGAGGSGASVVGSSASWSAKDAAFVNSQLAALLDMDETYRNAGHAGSPIVFAALASAEREHASGEAVLTGVLAAYDITSRIIDSITPSLEKWSTGIFPFCLGDAFGPAISSAVVLGLTESQVADALALSGGTARLPMAAKQADRPRSPMKNVQGWHAEHGVIAAAMAAEGFAGIVDILDGPKAFWAAAGSDRWRPDLITDGLGERCRIDLMSLKAQPACRLIHAGIESVVAAVRGNQVSLADIERIEVTAISRVANSPAFADQAPTAMFDAIFSLPYNVAAALLDVAPGPDWYRDDMLGSPELRAVAAKVRLVADPTGQLDAKYSDDPLHAAARARVITRDAEYAAECDAPKGDPANPYTNEELVDRIVTMTRSMTDAGTVRELADAVFGLESMSDIAALGELLRKMNGEGRTE